VSVLKRLIPKKLTGKAFGNAALAITPTRREMFGRPNTPGLPVEPYGGGLWGKAMAKTSAFFGSFMDELRKLAEEEGGREPSEDEIVNFFKKHPNPSDDAFHTWTDKRGINTEKAEGKAYRLASSYVKFKKGGASGGVPPKGISPKEVRQGISVEKEHTSSSEDARKVTGDHHTEIGPGYYPALVNMENVLKKINNRK
jgi:hypothetical protein